MITKLFIYIFFKLTTIYYLLEKENSLKNSLKTFFNYTNFSFILYLTFEYYKFNNNQFIFNLTPILFSVIFSVCSGYWTIIYPRLSQKEKQDKLNMTLDVLGHGPLLILYYYDNSCINFELSLLEILISISIPILWYIVIHSTWIYYTKIPVYPSLPNPINNYKTFICLFFYMEFLTIIGSFLLIGINNKFCQPVSQ